GPLGRGADGAGADAVLLCVPDHEIATAAAAVAPGRLVGHCSGATPLTVLEPHEAFSLHPLMTVTGAETTFAGAGAAIAGITPRALSFARRLAEALGMQAVGLGAGARGSRRSGYGRRAARCGRGARWRPAPVVRHAGPGHTGARAEPAGWGRVERPGGGSVKTIQTVSELRDALRPVRRAEGTIGLV